MKAITCELCGGNEFVKADGLFACVHCGTKYTPEEARALVAEITGTVSIDRTGELENIIKNADATFADGNYAEAYSLYSQALNIQFDAPRAILFRSISEALRQGQQSFNAVELGNSAVRAIETSYSQTSGGEEYADVCQRGCIEIAKLSAEFSSAWEGKLKSDCSDLDYQKNRKIARTKSVLEQTNLRLEATNAKAALRSEYYNKVNALIEMTQTVASAILERPPKPEVANQEFWIAARKLLDAMEPRAAAGTFTSLYQTLNKRYAEWKPAYVAAKGRTDEYNATEREMKGVEKQICEKREELAFLGTQFFKGAQKKEVKAQIEELEKQRAELDRRLVGMLM